MSLIDRVTGMKAEAQIKMINKGLETFLNGTKWTPSQAKLIRIQMVMNELEGKRGQEVFETTKSLQRLSKLSGKKANEQGAREYIDRIKAIVDEKC